MSHAGFRLLHVGIATTRSVGTSVRAVDLRTSSLARQSRQETNTQEPIYGHRARTISSDAETRLEAEDVDDQPSVSEEDMPQMSEHLESAFDAL